MRKIILNNRPSGFRATAVVIHNEQLLLMKQIVKGEVFYSLPGGHWEFEETLEQTCEREVMEEFTIKVNVGRLIYLVDTESRLNFVFNCKYISGVPTLGGPEGERMNEDEQYFPMWVSIKNITDLNITPLEAKDALLSYIANKHQPAFFTSNINKYYPE